MSQVPSEESESDLRRRKEIYEDRKTDFVQHFVNSLSLLGYIIIVIQFIKFETSFWVLLVRTSFHSLLTNPFPSYAQLRRIAQRTSRRTTDTEGVDMPGGFTNAASILNVSGRSPGVINGSTDPLSEDEEIAIVKRKIRKLLFHGSVTLNVVVFLWGVFHPTYFFDKLGEDHPKEKYLESIPSPFISGNGLLGGEFRGVAFIQFIGEAIPKSDLWGNFNKSGYDFLIIILQYTLFILTCINFGELGYVEPADLTYKTSDGYDGHVTAVQVDYNEPLGIIINDIPETNTQ